jgi:hypothetical protein
MIKFIKVSSKHISAEWDEGDDGYWIALKPGWKWAGDVVGAVHCIHEDTKIKAHRESVVKCNCQGCNRED